MSRNSEVHELSSVWQMIVVTRPADGRKDKYYRFTDPATGKSRQYRSLNEIAKDTSVGAYIKDLEFPKGSKAVGVSAAEDSKQNSRKTRSPTHAGTSRSAPPKDKPPSQRTVTDWMIHHLQTESKSGWKRWVEAYVKEHSAEFGTQTRSEAAKVLGSVPEDLTSFDLILQSYMTAYDETTAMLRTKYPKGTKDSVIRATPAILNLSKAAVNLLYRHFFSSSQ
jgi:hypothetical protein